ncbi:GIY-YIG nuclease family protein, partial [Delftia tsuruhatensis]|uniref:GIY-YIG nuclease family protein n=1 Tax=Delftia tsuruhatensis TaxID=180282 RepID=UPI0024475577
PEPPSGRQANRPSGGFFVSENERAAVKQFVYVMKSISGLVKIGVSARPDVRRAALETGSGFPVSIVETFGPFNRATVIESAAHDLLSSRRQCGEWFDCEAIAATAAVRRAMDGFVDAPDGDPVKEQAAIEELAKWAASGIVRPVEQFADAAQEVLSRYENLSGRYAELTDQFVEACELVEFYSDHAKHAVFIAQKSMDRIKRLEGELAAMKAAGCAATK